MSDQGQNLQQQTQDQYLQQAQEFFAQSMGRIKGQMQSDSAQLENITALLPEEARAYIQEMIDSYAQFEGSIDQAAQDAGVQDTVDQAAQQEKQSYDEAAGQVADQAQDTAGQAAQQVQDTAGQATDQAGQAVGQAQQMAGQATDQVGQVAGQAQDTAGQAAQQGQQDVGQAAQQAASGPLPGSPQTEPWESTEAAQQKAQELGVDLSQVQGSGAGGRITVRDVISASNQ